MEALTFDTVKKKSISGIVALTSRTFLIQIIAFTATAVLMAYLDPAIFGVFYIVSAVINFLRYFSDIGLAAALIQKKSQLTLEDYRTTFTIQQILVAFIIIVALLLTNFIKKFYSLSPEAVWLFWALLFSFFLSSLKTIPTIIMERHLEFKKLIIPQILETIGFYVVAAILAWQGLKLTTFTYAVVVQSLVGLIATYFICPWKISFGMSGKTARSLLTFGIPFQLNSFLALVKDDLFTLFLGKVLPLGEIGYIGWAKKWAEIPLRLFLDSVVKVTFPAFSRLQQARPVLGKAINETLFGLSATIFPAAVGLLFLVEPLIALVPRYAKWQPALFSFGIFVVSSAISALSVPLTNTLNAIGKIKITLNLMIMWTVLTWILSFILINMIGFNGVAVAFLLITSTVSLVIYIVKRFAPLAFISAVGFPFIGALLESLWFYVVLQLVPNTLINLILAGIIGLGIYMVFVYQTQKQRILRITGRIFG
ncbi:hypothetical protein A2154_03615 [Candidatus Gottesmanbacteria bacterium RBG_16_43_7]|uniref:Uncharacterized protein n=1 Tax=Candidatus Gottesmanbacteria bacterium RBG_16_43_7 TaxID=1798373 RepID=A0A1F5Z7I5_9BACT|nr:MAG: hypothetical protein A2154_03615 [Candidatus Gottesmanbacteria bacterium RBG_16_43_7]